MLLITIGNGAFATPKQYSWHAGENHPFGHDPNLVNFVTHVQADGDELEFVRSRFNGSGAFLGNVPDRPFANVVRWYGDHAKFIIGNL